MKDLEWFPPIPERRATSAAPLIWSALAGTCLGLLLLARGHRFFAIFGWAVTLLLGICLHSTPLRGPILRSFRWLGTIVGRVATITLLWPFYVLVFGGVRLVLGLTRIDLLDLRLPSTKPTYWAAAVPEQQRAKYYDRLYTIGPARRESRRRTWAAGAIAFLLFLAAGSELILGLMGFGHPIVYRVDPRVGYYPAPNQDVHRYGGNIHINAFGMRSGNVAAQKPADAYRILMLGDSTLYGGSYLDQSQIYASRLEGLLDRARGALPGPPRHVEVLAMGVNAWGPQHELGYVDEFGLFQASLVMVMAPPNDAYRPLYGIGSLPFYAEGHRPRFAWQEFWDHLEWQYGTRTTAAREQAKVSRQASDVLAKGTAAWLEIARLAQAQGVRVDFEFLPNEDEAREGHASSATQQVLDALLPDLAAAHVTYAYPLAMFRNELGVPHLYHDAVHLGAAGHRIYAAYLRDRVLKLAMR